MAGMSALLNRMIIFVALMLVGYLGARRQLLTPSFTKAASFLTMNLFMAGTILNTVAKPVQVPAGEVFKVILLCTGVILLGYGLSFLLTRLLKLEAGKAPLFELLISVMNTMFIGVPVLDVLYGSQAVFYLSLSNLPFNLLVYSYGVWRLKGEGGAMRWKDILSVPLLTTLVAIGVFLLRRPLPGLVSDLASALAGATMPVSMLVIGSSLGKVDLLDAFREKSLYLVSLVRLVVLPLLTAWLSGFFTDDPVLRASLIILAACPSGIIVSILALQYGKDVEYSSKGVLLDTTLSMLTIPLIVAFLL